MLDKNELPGMLALELAVKENKWPHTMDAQVWTKEWLQAIRSNPEIPNDEGTMLSWFANAIMAGYDTAVFRIKNNRKATISIDDFLDIVIANLGRFIIKWENHNKAEPHAYPLTQDNFSEWWKHFVMFVEEEENVDAN